MKDKCDWLISRLNMIKGKNLWAWGYLNRNFKKLKSKTTKTEKMSKIIGLLQKCNKSNGNTRRKKERMDKKKNNWNNVKLMFDTEPQIQKSQTRGSRLNSPKPSEPGISFLNYIKLKKNCPERSKRGWCGKPYLQRSNDKELHPISP